MRFRGRQVIQRVKTPTPPVPTFVEFKPEAVSSGLEFRRIFKELMQPVARPVVVEVGAWLGEDFEAHLGREVLHIAVEPDPRNIAQIEQRPTRRIIQAAIAAESGERTFYFSNDQAGRSCSGSLLKPTGHLTRYPETVFHEGEKVKCLTLDDLYTRENLSQVDFIWCDVQGAEGEVIRGGTEALKRTHYFVMESEPKEMYEGDVRRDDLLRMLPAWKLIAYGESDILLENTNWK
jgi:2-O-methyltransferase